MVSHCLSLSGPWCAIVYIRRGCAPACVSRVRASADGSRGTHPVRTRWFLRAHPGCAPPACRFLSPRRRFLPESEAGRDGNVAVALVLVQLDEIPGFQLEHLEEDRGGVPAGRHVPGELVEVHRLREVPGGVFVVVAAAVVRVSQALLQVPKDADRVLVPLGGRRRSHAAPGHRSVAFFFVVVAVSLEVFVVVRVEDHVVDHAEFQQVFSPFSALQRGHAPLFVVESGRGGVFLVFVFVVRGGRKQPKALGVLRRDR
mmetsp:Transcript_11148/g.23573  ORF Transcript_11148/g.23573 Transcript_11148/m.23573 type:complete len:257 (+) Transcript_11148:231-1001(+)